MPSSWLSRDRRRAIRRSGGRLENMASWPSVYSWQPVLNAGVISVTAGICIVSIGGLVIDHKPPSLLLLLGLGLVVAGAIISVYARNHL